MSIRFATEREVSNWDDLLTKNPDGGNVFQTHEMAETKRLGGAWRPRFIIANGVAIMAIERRVFSHGTLWYVPKGPGVTSVDEMAHLVPELQTFAKQHGVFAVKLEPEIIETAAAKKSLLQLGLVPTPAVQPNASTVIIDLSPSLDAVLAGLNQKGRHAINRAKRDGVTAVPVELTDANMRIMFDLLTATAAGRFESSLRPYAYYKHFWQHFVASGHGQLFFAYVDSTVVAAAYCVLLGKKGLYKDGASIREKITYGASHLLQWEIISWMKSQGATSYDLCGSPHSSVINDPSVSFHNIGRFKTSFNKHVTDYVGAYDLVVNPRAYRRWQQYGQRLFVSLTWRLKKRQWY